MRTFRRSRGGVFLLCAVLALALLGGCGRLEPVPLIDDTVAVPEPRAVIFFVDGLNAGVVNAALAAGHLPNIDRYFHRGGAWVDNAITVAPSITYAVTVSLTTGLAPGNHNVLGNRYFDPQQLAYIDYGSIATYRDVERDFVAPTLYEMLDDVFSVTIQTPQRRGATHNIDNWASSGIRWFFGYITEIDALTAERFESIGEIARQANRWPGLIFAYFPAVDEMGHRYGPHSQEYHDALVNVDEQIGRICAALDDSRLLEGSYLVLTSDHGMAPVETQNWLDPDDALERQFGLRVTSEGPGPDVPYGKRAQFFNRYDAVTTNGGYRRVAFYLRGPDGWHAPGAHPLAPEIAAFLARQPAVALAAWPENGRVGLVNRQGRAWIERRPGAGQGLDGWQYRYCPVDSGDPLDYAGHPLASALADGQWHGGDQWLAATADTGYPDAVVALTTMFQSPRAGDVVAFAADGWDFSPAGVGGHGSVRAPDMRTVLALAGPNITPGERLDVARLVDVTPTVLEMLRPGRSKNYHLDGQNLLQGLPPEENDNH